MTEERPSPPGDPVDPPGAARQFLLRFPAQPHYTFDSFIDSPSTAFAVASAKSLARDPDPASRSLFVSGPAGAGKTHLLMALGNEVAQSGVEPLFLSCKLWNERLESTTLDKALQWAGKVVSHPLLLVDDVDCLNGKPRGQEILYQVYNELRDRGGRLAMTSRTRPNELKKTEPFLVSRLQWGLTAELNPPGDEALERILHKLARDGGLELPESVARFLIQRLPRDFASLREAVETINRESLAQKKKVSLGMVKNALKL